MSIPSSDILYNIKSYFPIEKNSIDSLEAKEKSKKEEGIKKYTIYHPKPDFKKLNHSDMICYVCNNPDYSDINQIVFCSICNISVH